MESHTMQLDLSDSYFAKLLDAYFYYPHLCSNSSKYKF